MEKKANFFILYLSLIYFLCGCAIGNKYSYHDVVANITVSGNKAIGVATHDHREYVLSGRKNTDFIGLQRGGYGNPFDVSTESGRALADDMTEAIVSSLSMKGFRAISVIVLSSDDFDKSLEKLKSTQGERLVLLTLNEWKSDTYMNVALIYDANLKVYDNSGKLIAETNIKGKDDLRGSFFNPPAYAKKAVPEAFKQKVEELFNNPDITRALQ